MAAAAAAAAGGDRGADAWYCGGDGLMVGGQQSRQWPVRQSSVQRASSVQRVVQWSRDIQGVYIY